MHCKSFWLTKWRICFFAWLHAHAGSSTMKIICNVNACQRSAVIDQLTWGVFRRARLKLNVLQVVQIYETTLLSTKKGKEEEEDHKDFHFILKNTAKNDQQNTQLKSTEKEIKLRKKNIKKDNTVQNESSTVDNSAKPKGSHRCVRKKKGLKP